jgi:uncharacterized protein (UPF0179 family)
VAQVTLLHAPQARTGAEFVYHGPMPECEGCRVRGACLNQEVGTRYRVTAVREIRHPCPLTQDAVAAVEVEPFPPRMSWWSKSALTGSTVSYAPLDCDRVDCVNYATCHPLGVAPGRRIRIEANGRRLECPLGYDLSEVSVKYTK